MPTPGLIRKVRALLHEQLAHCYRIRTIQAQRLNGRTTSRSSGDHPRTVPREMLLPHVLARVEQSHSFPGSGIHTREVRAFVTVAEAASQREVFRHRLASMLLGYDMIEMEGKFG